MQTSKTERGIMLGLGTLLLSIGLQLGQGAFTGLGIGMLVMFLAAVIENNR